MKHISFIDTEVSESDNKAYDFGAVNESDDKLHTGSVHEFHSFIANAEYLCGHNIINHDSKYIEAPEKIKYIDTLYLSPLLFPNKPYHALLKDNPCFSGFFEYIDFSAQDDLATAILVRFSGDICESAPIASMISESPVELAYCLALLSATEKHSLIPRWVLISYPKVDTVLRLLRNTSCYECEYCKSRLNPTSYLSKYFGYPSFRTYNDEPLQENAVKAAVEHKSLLAIFPTGGGKSLTFQIPALMSGETKRALTVVISPL